MEHTVLHPKEKQVNGWHSSSNQNSSMDPTALQDHQIEIVEWNGMDLQFS
jgi:hypothetical protein